MSWSWIASLCRLRASKKHGPIVISNPWVEGISPAHLELIRAGSLAYAQEVFLSIDSWATRKQKKQAHYYWETYKEIVFIAGCRLWALDGDKEYSHELWIPHLKAVQDLVLERIKQHSAMNQRMEGARNGQ
jgi:hypothetical protein